MRFPTLCARGESDGAGLNPAVVFSSTFRFRDQEAIDRHYRTGEGFLYSRESNPTVRTTERRLAELEGAEDAALFASGMAAISTTLLSMAASGERIAAQSGLYGGTICLLRDLLPRLGIEIVWLAPDELSGLAPERIRGCRLLYLESPTNPTLRVIDLERVAEVADRAKVPVVVDSTFATPALQRPLTLGCSLVVHSGTKYLGGHSDLVGGVAAGPKEMIAGIVERRTILGGCCSPMSAFLLHRGLRTLAVRMEAHQGRATAVANALREHPAVRRVFWPGFGGMVSFEAAGGIDAATAVHDRLELFIRAASLGGVESTVSLPARMSHRRLAPDELAEAGIAPGLLRLSVGLESADDLVADLKQALDSL